MKLLISILLILSICLNGAERRRFCRIVQTFPRDITYCCRFPNINLKCTFSENPVIAFWTDGDPGLVIDSAPGHTVEKSNGALILKVSRAQYSRNKTYFCNAEYSDGKVRSDPFVIPEVEDLHEPIHWHVTPAKNTLDVTWHYKFPECRKFTVLLNGMPVPECKNIRALLNCTIRNLDEGVRYKITLKAKETAHTFEVSQFVTTLDQTTDFYSRVPGICIWLPILLTLPVLALLILIICFVILIKKQVIIMETHLASA